MKTNLNVAIAEEAEFSVTCLPDPEHKIDEGKSSQNRMIRPELIALDWDVRLQRLRSRGNKGS